MKWHGVVGGRRRVHWVHYEMRLEQPLLIDAHSVWSG